MPLVQVVFFLILCPYAAKGQTNGRTKYKGLAKQVQCLLRWGHKQALRVWRLLVAQRGTKIRRGWGSTGNSTAMMGNAHSACLLLLLFSVMLGLLLLFFSL